MVRCFVDWNRCGKLTAAEAVAAAAGIVVDVGRAMGRIPLLEEEEDDFFGICMACCVCVMVSIRSCAGKMTSDNAVAAPARNTSLLDAAAAATGVVDAVVSGTSRVDALVALLNCWASSRYRSVFVVSADGEVVSSWFWFAVLPPSTLVWSLLRTNSSMAAACF